MSSPVSVVRESSPFSGPRQTTAALVPHSAAILYLTAEQKGESIGHKPQRPRSVGTPLRKARGSPVSPTLSVVAADKTIQVEVDVESGMTVPVPEKARSVWG